MNFVGRDCILWRDSFTDSPLRRSGRFLYGLHASWTGQGDIHPRIYTSAGRRVHRVKVDEQKGIVIASHSTGGISVSDLKTDTLLWELGSVSLNPRNHQLTATH